MIEKYKGFLPRRLFGEDELNAINNVFKNSWATGVDFGYQGKYEAQLCERFNEYLGGNGYVDAVSSGTAALYIALKALGIGVGDEVAISPITSPGGVNPIIEVGATLTLIDSRKGTNLVDLEQVKKSVTGETKAIVITHAAGYPVFDLQEISLFAKERGLFFIEDCSQAHGAEYNKKKVGTFSDIAVWSTMYSKTLSTGGTGGLVYTKDENLYKLIRANADRGKDLDNVNNTKDPNLLLFPALNFNLDELSCAIGISVLYKLDLILKKRRGILKRITEKIDKKNGLSVYLPCLCSETSPFYVPVIVDEDVFGKTKKELTTEMQKTGIPLNPNFKEVVSYWPWVSEYISGVKETPNAIEFINSTFNLYLHEKYTDHDVDYINAVIDNIISNR